MEYTPNEAFTITATKEGYMTGRLSGIATPPEDGTILQNGTSLFPAAFITNVVTQAEGVDAVDETKGHAVLWGFKAGVEGVAAGISFEITPADGGVGPVYFAEGDLFANVADNNAYDSEASVTTSAGFANLINMEPGDYSVSAKMGDVNCAAFIGLPGDGDVINFDIAAGQLTYIAAVCP